MTKEDDRIMQLLVLRADLAKAERKIKQGIDEVKEEAIPLMLAHGLKTVSSEVFGSMTVVDGSSVSINREKLKLELLKYVSVEQAMAIMDACTVKSAYTTLQYRATKGPK